MIYVICTDRTGGEMRPGGIMLEKHVFICDNLAQAERVQKALKVRTARFSAIQMTRTMPVLNPRVYHPVIHSAAGWLQGR